MKESRVVHTNWILSQNQWKCIFPQTSYIIKNDKLDTESDFRCNVCYEVKPLKVQLSPQGEGECRHYLCAPCVSKLHRVGDNKCPICRRDVIRCFKNGNYVVNVNPEKVDSAEYKSCFPYLPLCQNIDVNNIREWISEYKCDVKFENDQGMTALHAAALKGNKEMVECLLEFSEINKQATTHNGESALDYAYKNYHVLIVNILMRNGVTGKCSSEILWQAVQRRNFNMIDLLLSQDVNAAKAIRFIIKKNQADMLKYFFYKKELNINMPLDERKSTPLIYAVKLYSQNGMESNKNAVDVVNNLLNYGANINLGDAESFTPLMVATGYGNTFLVQHLLSKEANVNLISAEEAYGVSALSFAAMLNKIEVFKILDETPGIDKRLGEPLKTAIERKSDKVVFYCLMHELEDYMESANNFIKNFLDGDNSECTEHFMGQMDTNYALCLYLCAQQDNLGLVGGDLLSFVNDFELDNALKIAKKYNKHDVKELLEEVLKQ